MGIGKEVHRIKNAKSALAAAIAAQGIELPDGAKLDEYAEAIRNIKSEKILPPESCTKLFAYNTATGNRITWTDPEDILFNGIPVIWAGTKIIRKENTPPVNETDGILVADSIVRNQYQSEPLIDSNVESDKKIFYSAFPYSTQGAYGRGVEIQNVSNDLNANSWEVISKISEMGMASKLWKIGDKKNLDFSASGLDFEKGVQIWAFDRYEKTDKKGKAGIVFGSNETLHYPTTNRMNTGIYNDGGWNEATLRNDFMKKIYEALPDAIKPFIKEVFILSNDGYNDYTTISTSEKIFIPSLPEVIEDADYGSEGSLFPIFTNDSSRIKLNYGKANRWWLRSADKNDRTKYKCVNEDGTIGAHYTNNFAEACICFCI